MTRLALLPHRTARRGVRTGPWTTRIDGVEADLSVTAPEWDPALAVECRSEVAIDADEVRDQCGLSGSDVIEVVVTWSCETTNVRRLATRHRVDGTATVPLHVRLDPGLAIGPVTLARAVVLGSARAPDDPAVAHRIGSVLWRESPSDATTVVLGPPRHRLSTEVVDFRMLPEFDAGAAWVLDGSLTDLDRPADEALRVLLNARHPGIKVAIDGAHEDGAAIRSVLRWDVGRALLERALDDDSVDEPDVHGGGSVGEALHDLLRSVLPGTTLAELRELRRERPAAYHALVQSRLGLLEDR